MANRQTDQELAEQRAARQIVDIVREQIKDRPVEDQERLIRNFCDALDAHLSPHPNTSSSD